MNFFNDLIEARFLKRYNSLQSEHKLVSVEKVLTYCPNTVPMIGLLIENSITFLSESKNKIENKIYMGDGNYR